MHSRIIFRKLILTGTEKKDAIIDFKLGLNVIAGASDTGKSFAFECINFILGSSEIPACPPEAKGYQSVFLEMEDSRQKEIFTLRRDFSQDDYKSIYICYSEYEGINDANFEKLSSTHRAKKSLSKKLLKACDCSYETIIGKVTKGSTQSFTFRSFIPMIMIGELRVTEKHSPIYRINPRGSNTAISELTAFQTVISGNDYEKKSKEDSVEIVKAKLKGRIEELSQMIEELRIENVNLADKTKDVDQYSIAEEIENINKFIEVKNEEVKQYETEFGKLQIESEEIKREIYRLHDNINKFYLLKKNYLSDLERLEFIFDAHDLTEQLVDVECPICHSSIQVEDNKNSKEYFVALSTEKAKIEIQLSELEDTIADMEDEAKEKEHFLENMIQKSERISDELNAMLMPIVSQKVNQVQALLEVQEQMNLIIRNDEKVKQYNSKISTLMEKIDAAKENKGYKIEPLSEAYITGLCKEITVLLRECNFIGQDVEVIYNNITHDIKIGGKEKATYGKGARAIINSIFLIGIMNYCIDRDLCHPGVVVLDSPLTTYKEKDKKDEEHDESVGKGTKEKFYEMLEKEESKKQIIIFDNEEPNEKMREKINYLHFSGDMSIGRKGFIPE